MPSSSGGSNYGDRKRDRQKRRPAAPQSGGLPLSEVVCTAQGVASSKNSVELGLLLSLAVLGLYFYGCYQAGLALPEISLERPLGGENLNLAKLGHFRLKHSTQNQGAGESLSKFIIPFATWPVTLRDEIHEYETILHPGDLKTEMSVPKFWSSPLHDEHHAFTRAQADKVGSCIEADPTTGSHVRGYDCPPDQRTIFLAIASYRDFQCRKTVESVFTRAQNPERIRVGK